MIYLAHHKQAPDDNFAPADFFTRLSPRQETNRKPADLFMPECKLFFAEFWNQADVEFERSNKPPCCCPIQDYHAHLGCCFICEAASVRVVHPPCGNYFIGRRLPIDELCAVAERKADLGGMLQSDVIDIDREKDVGSAKILSGSGLSIPEKGLRRPPGPGVGFSCLPQPSFLPHRKFWEYQH